MSDTIYCCENCGVLDKQLEKQTKRADNAEAKAKDLAAEVRDLKKRLAPQILRKGKGGVKEGAQ
jgi:hypothetical protein